MEEMLRAMSRCQSVLFHLVFLDSGYTIYTYWIVHFRKFTFVIFFWIGENFFPTTFGDFEQFPNHYSRSRYFITFFPFKGWEDEMILHDIKQFMWSQHSRTEIIKIFKLAGSSKQCFIYHEREHIIFLNIFLYL